MLREEDMPTNSDIVLIISQFETAIGEFKNRYCIQDQYKFDQFGDRVTRWMSREFPPDYYANESEE